MAARIGADDVEAFDSPRPELLREVTGIAPETSGSHVRLDLHAHLRSTQRLALGDVGGGVIVAIWPAELKSQARYLYSAVRAGAMIGAARGRGWSVDASPHLAFYNSRPSQRLYMSPTIRAEEYASRWEGADGARIGQYSPAEVRSTLWPWLKERGYASRADDHVLEDFLTSHLKQRPAHLRPGLRFRHTWDRGAVAGMDVRELAGAIRTDVNAILEAADEPTLGSRLFAP